MSRRSQAGLPLHLCQVLEEETASLWGLDPASPTWDFTRGDLDEEALLARLRNQQSGTAGADRVAAALRGLLAPDFVRQLDDESRPDDAELPEALIDQLNRLLGRPDLAGSLLLDEAEAPPELRALAAAAGDPDALRRVNRLVLEAAFPDETESVYERRLAAAYRRMPPSGALCLSGGGVRSAVFSLGVVQALARHGLLPRFDFLSTVSGGGYLGGMLTAWIHRPPPRGIQGVAEELIRTRRPSALTPEARPIAYLRRFSNYLSPRPGLLSADTWSLVAVYLRNLVLHWLILVPLLVGVVLVPWLYLTFLRWGPTEPGDFAPWLPRWGPLAALPDVVAPANLALFLMGSGLMSGAIAYIGLQRPSGGRTSLQRRAGARRNCGRGPVAALRRAGERVRKVFAANSQPGFLLLCLLPLVASAAALSVFWAWHRGVEMVGPPAPDSRPDPGWGWFLVPSMAINVTGWAVHAIPWFRRQRRVQPKIWELPAALVAGCFGGMLTRVVALSVFPYPVAVAPKYVAFALPALLGIFLAGETLFAGLVSRWSDDQDREWWSRSGGWILIAIVVWIGVSMAVIAGPPLLLQLPQILAPLGGISAIATALLAHSAGSSQVGPEGEKRGLAAKAMDWGLALVAPLFVVMLVAGLALAVGGAIDFVETKVEPGLHWMPAKQGHLKARLEWDPPSREPCAEVAPIPICLEEGSLKYVEGLFTARLRPPLLTLAAAVLLAMGLALLMNINRFSLHATYRNRLIRTFLGATRERRWPNRFTGFDPGDNFPVHRLASSLFLQQEALSDGGVALCRRLRDDWSEGVRAIRDRLSVRTRAELDRLGDGQGPPRDLVGRVIADCNRLLRFPFDERLQAQLEAPQETANDDEEGIAARRRALVSVLCAGQTDRPPRPFHIVNLAVNLVRGENLAWQQRKAESFTVSPLHCGSLRIGYRPATEYGGGDRRSALTFGTAMAISGAAASPNMGYHSSPAITFLMTFFNVRLGWWLGNPGPAGARGQAWRRSNPLFAVGPLIAETLGLTNDRRRYVYLSDGGHFENLGLYEMVLRRCPWIVVVDAGQDPDCRFEDLANAVRKVRVDLGVDIRFERMPIRRGKEAEQAKGRYCALATIRYPDGTEGRLLYFKPVVYGDEPRDVVHYHAKNPQFPHESTGDQWFSESQFESYRRLGAHAVDTVVGAGKDRDLGRLEGLFECAGDYLAEKAEPPGRPARARRAARSSA